MAELKCLTCIHGELCLEQKGGVDLHLASDNDCKCYKSTNEYKEVKHGEWIHTDKAKHWAAQDECSECAYHTWDRDNLSHLNYCPNCGTLMDGGKTE